MGWTLGQAARRWTSQDLLHYSLQEQRGEAAEGSAARQPERPLLWLRGKEGAAGRELGQRPAGQRPAGQGQSRHRPGHREVAALACPSLPPPARGLTGADALLPRGVGQEGMLSAEAVTINCQPLLNNIPN